MLLEKVFSIFLFIIACIFSISSYQLSSFNSHGVLGSGFFPQVVSTLLVITTLGYILYTFRKGRKKDPENMQSLKKQFLFILSLGLTFLLIFGIGMLPSLGLFMFVSNIFLGKLSWLKSLIFTVLLVLIVYLIFVIGLNIRIPSRIIL